MVTISFNHHQIPEMLKLPKSMRVLEAKVYLEERFPEMYERLMVSNNLVFPTSESKEVVCAVNVKAIQEGLDTIYSFYE
jgi:hypothetical protein